jgi:hypothetical protein
MEGPSYLGWLEQTWIKRIQLAAEARKTYMLVADQCWMFTFRDTTAMWQADNRKRFGAGIEPPKFQISVNKGKEYLDIFGPYLFWRYPHRDVRPLRPLELRPEMFGDPRDPMAMQAYEAAAYVTGLEQAQDELRCQLMSRYLNFSQREQPYGGLETQGLLAIIDALIAGRGVLWPQTYNPGGSQRTLTGLFWGSYRDFFSDPDSMDPTLKDAKWICRRHVSPHWEVEERFGCPKDSLKKCARLNSVDTEAVNRAKGSRDSCHDNVIWYEIWSRGGVGFRMKGGEKGSPQEKAECDALDELVGDFAYLCICEGYGKPLNAPMMEEEQEPETIRESFQWPFPSHIDDRWPVAMLQFSPEPGSSYPNPPLASALGEIIALNALISAATEMTFENRKQVIAHLASSGEKIKEVLSSDGSIQYLELNDHIAEKIEQVVSFLKRPEMNYDVWKVIDMLEQMIARRTGLVEFMYAQSSTQSRTASDVQSKEEKASIRPEKMSKDVASFMSEAATLESQLAAMFVTSQDIAPLLGTSTAYLWDSMIHNTDPEMFARQFRVTIEASDIRKPNKAQEAENLQTMSQFMLPVLQAHAMNSGDPSSLNAFIKSFGDSIEQDTSQWMTGPWMPEPQEDPAIAQAQTEIEMQRAANETSKVGAEIEETLTSSDLNEAKIREIEDKIKKGYYKPKPAAKPSGGTKK